MGGVEDGSEHRLHARLDDRLARFGYGRWRRRGRCWEVARIGAATQLLPHAPASAGDEALAAWLNLLAEEPRPSPYRIQRING